MSKLVNPPSSSWPSHSSSKQFLSISFSSSKKFATISYKKVLSENLKVMDSSAISLARDNNIPMVVFSILEKNAFEKAVKGQGSNTIITEE